MRWKSEKFFFASPCLSTSSTPHYSRHCHHITHPHCSWRPAGRSRCCSGWCSRCAGSPAPPRGPGDLLLQLEALLASNHSRWLNWKINLLIIAMIIQINNQSLATSLPENLPLKRRQSWKSSKQLDKKTCTEYFLSLWFVFVNQKSTIFGHEEN